MRPGARPGARRTLATGLLVLALMLAAAAGAGARTVWLCKPGLRRDPCAPGLSTTLYSRTLRPTGVLHPRPERPPAADCFYVYPTVSDQKGPVANLSVDPEERSIALYQAARYSQVCRVFAPMYRQVTVPALQAGYVEDPAHLAPALHDVYAAFQTYLRDYNHGRPFVLIGHSQGASILNLLLARYLDREPARRAHLLSAIILGGDVLVRSGKGIGGYFKHVPACRSATSLSCVIAYSTYDQTPPPNSIFGRVNRGDTVFGSGSGRGEQVLCVNPAALLGHRTVTPIFPSQPFAPHTLISAGIALLGLTQPRPRTVWSEEPDAYTARCSTAAGASVLRLTALPGAQVAHPSPDATWGLHLLDANIELGDLVTLVGREAQAYARRHPHR